MPVACFEMEKLPPGKIGSALRQFWAHLTFAEVSGSLGDLGTFLPLTVGLASTVGLDFGTTLIFTGLYNIGSGIIFGCPMCVQPMHTISGIALAAAGAADALTIPQIMAAGIFVSGVVLLLGLTRLAELAAWLVPPAVIRGVQLGVGMKVAAKGFDMAMRVKVDGKAAWRQLGGVEGMALGGLALAFLLVTTIAPKLAGDLDWPPLPRGTALEVLLQRWRTSSSSSSSTAQQGRSMPRACCSSASAGGAQGAAAGAGSDIVEDAEQQQQQLLPRDAEEQQQQPLLFRDAEEEPLMLSRKAPKAQPHSAHSMTVSCCSGASQAAGSAPAALSSRSPGHKAEGAAAAAADTAACCAGPSVVPSALLVVLLGLLLSAVAHPDALSALRLGPSIPRAAIPSWDDFKTGIWRAGLPQLPLTTLNSVVAVTQLAGHLFPDRDQARFRPSRLALSVGAMNLLGCWLGAAPTCHGSGGLAAQFKFGARHGAAPIMLGLVKLGLGLLLGSSLLQLMQGFPGPLLGAMLALAGVELACSARAETSQRGYTIMMVTACCILSLDTGIGFVMGWLAAALVAAAAWAARPAGRLTQRLCTWGKGTERSYDKVSLADENL